MHIFVTGASGFIGGHVARSLSREHLVRAMSRSARSDRAIERQGAVPVSCSLDDVGPVHLAGVDVVVHCAARAEDWGTREQFWEANVEGTRRVLEAARAAGARRFVHIGTEAALFCGDSLVGIDEAHPYPSRHRFPYSQTKAEAERLVLSANAEGFVTMSLRPRLVWGPDDRTVLPTLIDTIERGMFAWIDHGRMLTSTTHVSNLVHAIECALVRGRGGQAYFVADEEDRSVREFLGPLVATRGIEPPNRSVPGRVVRPLAALVERLWTWLRPGRRPPLTSFATTMMSRTVTVRIDKARDELGYRPPVAVDEGLAELRRLAAG